MKPLEVRKVSKSEFLSHEFSGFISKCLLPESQTIQTYLDAFFPEASEIFITSLSFIFLRSGDVPEVMVVTAREWTLQELNIFLENQEPSPEFYLRFQGPDCELSDWIRSQSGNQKLNFSLVPLNNNTWSNVRGNLRRQIKKGSRVVQSFTMEPYDSVTWKKDLESLKKFIVMNNRLIRDVVLLPDLFDGKDFPTNFYRTKLETTFGEMIGITSRWGKTWTADYHWSFHRYRAKEINLTSLYHWEVIKEALKIGVEYYNLGFDMKNVPGLFQYKSLWNPEPRSTFRVKTSLSALRI